MFNGSVKEGTLQCFVGFNVHPYCTVKKNWAAVLIRVIFIFVERSTSAIEELLSLKHMQCYAEFSESPPNMIFGDFQVKLHT